MPAVIGVVLSLSIFMSGVLIAGGSLLLFLDLPSIIIVVGFDFGALLVSGGMKHLGLGLRNCFREQADVDRKDLLAAAGIFGLMAQCSVGGGFIGLVMGIVMLLVNLNDPNNIGPYLAVAILTLLYGMLLAFLFFLPGKVKLTNLANGS